MSRGMLIGKFNRPNPSSASYIEHPLDIVYGCSIELSAEGETKGMVLKIQSVDLHLIVRQRILAFGVAVISPSVLIAKVED
jgi:hypothetical protein